MYCLIDCNNFYASCERLFRPDLRTTPIVVLSNNDGCVIARSSEAKALGIKMAMPFFQISSLIRKHRIAVFSSNYTLYGDISRRVMSIIAESWPQMEIYSIDEAFLDLRALPTDLHQSFCNTLQKNILRCTGIPTSIGIGPSKTLAKAANFIAKNKVSASVFSLRPKDYWLSQLEIGDVWGIGGKWASKLVKQGIRTAADLAECSPFHIRTRYNVVLMRTVMELQGTSCAGLAEAQPKQSIMSSKSFGVMQTHCDALAQAISSHVARACEKARAQNLMAQRVYVFLRSNRHRHDLRQYNNSMEYRLIHPSSDTCVINRIATECLKQLFKEGIFYKKVGVMLLDLIPNTRCQQDLFNPIPSQELESSKQLMGVLDAINKRFGRHTLRLASEGYNQEWHMRCEMRSPCYTTRWSEVPRVH